MIKIKVLNIGSFHSLETIDEKVNLLLKTNFADKEIVNAQLDIVRKQDSYNQYISKINLIVFYKDKPCNLK